MRETGGDSSCYTIPELCCITDDREHAREVLNMHLIHQNQADEDSVAVQERQAFLFNPSFFIAVRLDGCG